MENEETTLDDQTPSEEASGASSSDAVLDGDDGSQTSQHDPDEPLDNKERSRLGRRMSKFEQEFWEVKGTLSRLEQMLMMQNEPRQTYVQSPAADDDDDPDRILTVRELRDLQTKESRKKEEQLQRYSADYLRAVKSMYTEDPENHAMIEKELLTNLAEYPTWSNRKDAKADAIANYYKARGKVIEAKYKTASPNVRGGSAAATGVTNSTRQTSNPAPRVKLDEVSSKFAKAMQMDEDRVQKVLNE